MLLRACIQSQQGTSVKLGRRGHRYTGCGCAWLFREQRCYDTLVFGKGFYHSRLRHGAIDVVEFSGKEELMFRIFRSRNGRCALFYALIAVFWAMYAFDLVQSPSRATERRAFNDALKEVKVAVFDRRLKKEDPESSQALRDSWGRIATLPWWQRIELRAAEAAPISPEGRVSSHRQTVRKIVELYYEIKEEMAQDKTPTEEEIRKAIEELQWNTGEYSRSDANLCRAFIVVGAVWLMVIAISYFESFAREVRYAAG